MLHQFLTANRLDLIARCREKVALRPAPQARGEELEHGIAPFLDQLIKTLELEQTNHPLQSREVSGVANNPSPLSEVGKMAAQHGRELLQSGFTVEQVVHDYGDLCQSITDLAFERDEPVTNDEFRTLNRCLDNAIAEAVTAFNYHRDFVVADQQTQAFNEQLGVFAHELRNQIHTATLALAAIKAGHVGLSGSTGAILDYSLIRMSNLIDSSLADVRMKAKTPVEHRPFPLADFIAEMKISGSLQAQVREVKFTVAPVDPQVVLNADRDLLMAAVGNLLQNAFKFTHPNSEVTLNAYASADRILIEVEDGGAGLPAGDVETMFQPFTQGGENKSGLGLGLSISRRSVEANNGVLSARNLPAGAGCVFTIDLPRHSLA